MALAGLAASYTDRVEDAGLTNDAEVAGTQDAADGVVDSEVVDTELAESEVVSSVVVGTGILGTGILGGAILGGGAVTRLSRFGRQQLDGSEDRAPTKPSLGLELAWQQENRATRATIMALMYLISGCQSLLAARWGVGTDHPGLVAIMGALGVLEAPLLYAYRRRIPPFLLHLAAVNYALLLGVQTSIAITPIGVVGLGPAVIAICLMHGYFSTRRALLWHLGWAVGCFAVGMVASGQKGTAIAALTAVIVAVVAGLTLNRLSEKLRQQGSTDELTGILNRMAWMQITDMALASRHHQPVAVAILDLDNFKETNDNQGHLAGDAMLQTVAKVWAADLPSPAVLGRFGGDEFLVLFRGLNKEQAGRQLTLLQPIPGVSWTFGTAVAEPGESCQELLHRADSALIAAKKNRPGRG